MIFKESQNFDELESILKIPYIFNGLNYNSDVSINSWRFDNHGNQRFLICYHNNIPATLIIFEEPKSRTEAHFAVTPYGKTLGTSTELFNSSVNALKINHPEIKALTGSIHIENEHALNFYKKVKSRVIGYSDSRYLMELRI